MKERFYRLISFIKNPARFFEENTDDEKAVFDIAAFIIRLAAIVGFFTGLIKGELTALFLVILLFLLILLAKLFAFVGVVISAFVLNLSVKIFSGKSDPLAAKRIVAYALITSIIPEVSFLSWIAVLLVIILWAIGVSKQYKISLGRSLIISVAPFVLLALITIVLIVLSHIITMGWYR